MVTSLGSKLRNLVSYIWYRFISLPFRMMPIRQHHIAVSSFFGKGFCDNPKYIIERVLAEGKYKIVWLVRDKKNQSFPRGIKIVKRGTLSELYYLSTARIWIDNSRKPYGLVKRKKQFYIQTWHGGFPIKMIEKSVEEKLDRHYILSAKNDSRMIDVLLSNNGLLSKVFEKDFWYNGRILECGCPRNDIIYNNSIELKKKVYDYFKLQLRSKICIYAPTFRKNQTLDAYDIDYMRLKKCLEKKFGGEWKILIRLHPNISDKSTTYIHYNNDIIDASKYDDMQELLVAADFMITDYSSCIFDYAISKKKCCIYASDIDDYLKDRGFYMSLNEYPFEIATSNNELSKIIAAYDEKKSQKRVADFFDKVGCYEDGKGAEAVASIIKDVTCRNSKNNGLKKENKVLLFNTIMMYVMMASTFIFPLITLPYLTRTLGAANYGAVVLASAVMQYFQLFIDFGFILSGTSACSKERDNKEKLQKIVSAIVYGKLILSVIGVLVVTLLAYTLEVFKGKELFIICSYLPLILTSFVPDYLFRGIERMGVITFRTIVSKGVYTLLIFLLVQNAESYFFIPLSLSVSNLIIVFWSWSFIRKKLGYRLVMVDTKEIKNQLKASSAFFASRIATTVYSASNIFVLGLYGFSDTALGVYGVANTLIGYGKSMFSPIADSLYPYMIKNKNHSLVKKIIWILGPMILVGSAILFILSDSIIALMSGGEYAESVPIFRCMIPMLVIILPSYLYGFPMLGSIGRNDKANQSVFIGAAFHFMGLILLVVSKTLNFYTITILTTITEALILAVRVYFFRKYKNIDKNKK